MFTWLVCFLIQTAFCTHTHGSCGVHIALKFFRLEDRSEETSTVALHGLHFGDYLASLKTGVLQHCKQATTTPIARPIRTHR